MGLERSDNQSTRTLAVHRTVSPATGASICVCICAKRIQILESTILRSERARLLLPSVRVHALRLVLNRPKYGLKSGMRVALSSYRMHHCIALNELSLVFRSSSVCSPGIDGARPSNFMQHDELCIIIGGRACAAKRTLEKVCADRYPGWRLEKNRR